MKPLGSSLPGLPPPEPNAKPIRRQFPCSRCRKDIGRNVALCDACIGRRKSDLARGIAPPDPEQHWSDVEKATQEER